MYSASTKANTRPLGRLDVEIRRGEDGGVMRCSFGGKKDQLRT